MAELDKNRPAPVSSPQPAPPRNTTGEERKVGRMTYFLFNTDAAASELVRRIDHSGVKPSVG